MPRPPDLTTTRERALAAAAARYPDKRLPYGAVRAIAKELGVSGERIRQILVPAGYQSVAQPPIVRCCPVCGLDGVRYNQKVCDACHNIPIACETCGEIFHVEWREIRAAMAHPRRIGPPRFCSRACMADAVAQWTSRPRRGSLTT